MTKNFREDGYTGESVQYEYHNDIMQDFHTSGGFSADTSEKIFESLVEAVNNGCDAVAAAAFIYERKGYSSTISVDSDINNRCYVDDDVLLQVTVRVPHPHNSEIISVIREEKTAKELAEKEAEKIALDEEIERLKQKRAELD